MLSVKLPILTMCRLQRVNNKESWNVENTQQPKMFGNKGIKRFFFSWQKSDHDEVVQEKTEDLDQVKGNFLIRLLSWLFIPPTASGCFSQSTPILKNPNLLPHKLDYPYLLLYCQEKYLSVINCFYTPLHILSANWGHLQLEGLNVQCPHQVCHVALGKFEAFREFIHKNVKLKYEGQSNSYSIFRRKLQNHLILKSSEMQTPKKELSCWITIHQGECTNKKISSLEQFWNKILRCTKVKDPTPTQIFFYSFRDDGISYG